MRKVIDEQAAIDAVYERIRQIGCEHNTSVLSIIQVIRDLPSAQAEPTRIISETRAIPSDDDRVSLSEKVTATYYDEENEEWSRKIVTVRDVLDSVCDEYTVLPSARPERKKGKWVKCDDDWLKTMFKCSECGARIDINEKHRNFFCYHCGADMRGEQE